MNDSWVVLDTDVFSFGLKNAPEWERFKPLISTKKQAITFITVGEVYYGAYKRNWGSTKMTQLEEVIRRHLVLEYDDQIALEYGMTCAYLSRNGHPPHVNDAWIAAFSIYYEIPLVTNNIRHFSIIPNLQLITD